MPRTFQNQNNLLISCDVQPAYLSGCTFNLENFVQYMQTFNQVLYLFNNYKIGVEDTTESVIEMLKNTGKASDTDLKHIKFLPKVYWYFRDLTDNPDIQYSEIINILRMLIFKGVNSASELPIEDLKKCISEKYAHQLKTGKLKFYYDPNLALTLSRWQGATLVGGYEFQCLLEICIYLDALKIPYEKNYAFIY